MDPNLTYPVICNASIAPIINASINATLNQPSQPWWIPLVNPTAILLSALIGVSASLSVSIFGLHIKEQQDKHKMRRQTLSRLKGCRELLTGLLMDFGYAYVESKYYKTVTEENARILSEGRKKSNETLSIEDKIEIEDLILKSLPYREYERRHERSIVSYLEFAKCLKDLWEIIGLIQTLFPVTDYLKKKILPIDYMKTKYNKILKSQDNNVLSEGWLESKKVTLKNSIDTEIGPSIDDLINHLEHEIEIYDRMPLWQLYWKEFWKRP